VFEAAVPHFRARAAQQAGRVPAISDGDAAGREPRVGATPAIG
jgi:hypothetical protein